MSNVQAAIGCAQLERVDELVARRRDILCAYQKKLLTRVCVSMNVEHPETEIGAWMPTVVFWKESAEVVARVRSELVRNGVDARVFFSPLSSLPMFSSGTPATAGNSIAAQLSQVGFNLPSFHDLAREQVGFVCDIVAQIFFSEVKPGGNM